MSWLLGCKKEPKTLIAHHGAFQLTLPPGWSSTEQTEPTFDHFAATPPDGDGLCSFTFTDASGELFPEQYEVNFRKSAMKGFGASSSEPDSLEIAGTRFGGAHFKGHPPDTGMVGVLAKLAGEASVETYGGAIGSTYVGVMLATFAVTEDKKALIDGCRSIARSLKALRDSVPAPSEHAPPRAR
ncbi:MAG: hypothetical protein JNM69_15910 [Archangium sp.]|nr:hypothetical protein [Archangium sp.]